VVGPLVCGGLAAAYGWHVGFGTAGALMIVALLTYLAGQSHLPGGRTRKAKIVYPPLTPAERTRTWLLLVVIALTILPNIAYPMIWGVGVLWVDGHVSLSTPLGAVPASWFNSVDAFASIVAVPPLVALWQWQARRGREPGDVAKIGLGSALTGVSAAILAVGCLFPGADGRIAVYWPLIGFFGMGVAFLYFWPVLLALISRAAPAKMNATLMGGAFISLFLGSLGMGWVGSFYDRMTPAAFWSMDAAIGLVGGLIVFAIQRPLVRALEPPAAEATA
jgi:POT family proton-dependent oligopeptide transporter